MKYFLHFTYWFLAFFQGVFVLLEIPSFSYKVGMPAIVLLLITDSIIKKKHHFKNDGILLFLLLIIAALFSGFINNVDTFSIIYYLRYISLHYLYFLVIINEKNFNLLERIFNLIKVLFLIQIPAVLIKFIILGMTEKGAIGTLSTVEGSLSTTVPILASIFLVAKWLTEKKSSYLMLIILFTAFGIIGAKRAIVFFLPMFTLITYFIYIYHSNLLTRKKLIPKLIPILFVGLLAFVIIAKVNPTLNPEGKIWGTLDLNYLMDYTDRYTGTGLTKDDVSRQEALAYFWFLQLTKGTETSLFGDGAGLLIQSSFNENKGIRPMLVYYGIYYGGRMGLFWLFLQVGLVGLLLYVILLVKTVKSTVRIKQINAEEISIILAITGLFFVDTITYSNTFIYYQVLIGTFFFYMGYLKVKYASILPRYIK